MALDVGLGGNVAILFVAAIALRKVEKHFGKT